MYVNILIITVLSFKLGIITYIMCTAYCKSMAKLPRAIGRLILLIVPLVLILWYSSGTKTQNVNCQRLHNTKLNVCSVYGD